MNVKLSYNFDLPAIVVEDQKILPNRYNIHLNLTTATEDINHQNIAFERILFMINEIFSNTVFISGDNENLEQIVTVLPKNHFTILPEDPYDHIIGIMLYHKFSAITEEKFEINELIIGSTLSKDVKYTIDEFNEFDEEDCECCADCEECANDTIPWWDRSDITTIDFESDDTEDNISWDDIELNWDFVDEEKNTEIIFTPNKKTVFTVINGGPDKNDEDKEPKDGD